MIRLTSFLIFLISFQLSAQQERPESDPWYLWYDVHGQVGNGFVGDMALNLNMNKGLYAVEFYTAENYVNDCVLCDPPPNKLRAVNALIGRMWKNEFSYVAVSAGFGVVQYQEAVEAGTYDSFVYGEQTRWTHNRQMTVGLPLEIKGGFTAKAISIQLKSSVNLNPEMPMVSIGLGVGFGKFF